MAIGDEVTDVSDIPKECDYSSVDEFIALGEDADREERQKVYIRVRHHLAYCGWRYCRGKNTKGGFWLSPNGDETFKNMYLAVEAYRKMERDTAAPKDITAVLLGKTSVKLGDSICYRDTLSSKEIGRATITREGLQCNCCDGVYTCEEFETHVVGLSSALRHLFVGGGGESLIEKLAEMVDNFTVEDDGEVSTSERQSCCVCGLGSRRSNTYLLVCPSCNLLFHDCCVFGDNNNKQMAVPWVCTYCSCNICGGQAYRKSEMCGICGLWRNHIECSNQKDNVVCPGSCAKIQSKLERICGKAFRVRMDEEQENDKVVWWSILQKGKGSSAVNTISKLYLAYQILVDQLYFESILVASRRKLCQMILCKYSKVPCKNYQRFFTVTLDLGSEMVAAAAIRLFGKDLCEVAYIATRKNFQRKGYGKLLIGELEKKLRGIGIASVMVPALHGAQQFWSRLGYQEMSPLELHRYEFYPYLRFEDVTILGKRL